VREMPPKKPHGRPKSKDPYKTASFTAPQSLLDRIQKEADAASCSRSVYIRLALKRFLAGKSPAKGRRPGPVIGGGSAGADEASLD
jgi:hypothetical protein